MKTLDTRDLYKRKCELEELKEAVETAQEELDQHLSQKPDEIEDSLEDYETWEGEKEEFESTLDQAKDLFGTEEQEELSELEELESEVSDFMHGAQMIPVDDFEAYAEELAEELGMIDRSASWPFNCINWDMAANQLAQDYSVVTYQGQDYYVRS